MSEILAVVRASARVWLILDCGHWYKWSGQLPPRAGTDLPCPSCRVPTVVTATPREEPEG